MPTTAEVHYYVDMNDEVQGSAVVSAEGLGSKVIRFRVISQKTNSLNLVGEVICNARDLF